MLTNALYCVCMCACVYMCAENMIQTCELRKQNIFRQHSNAICFFILNPQFIDNFLHQISNDNLFALLIIISQI